MLKQILSVAAAVVLIAPAALAQDNKGAKVTVEETSDENGRVVITRKESKNLIKTNSFWSNWSIGLEGGVSYYLGDYDDRASFGERTAPAFNLYITKFATPAFGLGLTLGVNQLKGATPLLFDDLTGHFITGKHAAKEGILQSGWCFNPHIDALLDLDNIFCGYDPFRIYNVSLLLGGGILVGFDTAMRDAMVAYVEPTFNLGLLNSFRLTDRLNLLVNLRGLITGDNFDGETEFKKVDGAVSLTAGLSFKFGALPQRSFSKVEDVTVEHYNDKGIEAEKAKIQELERKVKALSAENDALAKAAAASGATASIPISLRIGVAPDGSIGNASRIDLMAAAEAIRSTPNTRYNVSGSAKDIESVMAILTGELGVAPAQLERSENGAQSGLVIISTLVK